MNPVTVSGLSAPRKGFGVHRTHAPAQDLYHVGAAFTYRILCTEKRLAWAWGINRATASKYRSGAVIGALTRIAWEIALLERRGIDTTPIWAYLRRVALHNRRRVHA